jgi:bifunctional non-homologous end joining protein LigD
VTRTAARRHEGTNDLLMGEVLRTNKLPEQRKDKRKGRLYLDAMRNAYAQTAVPPYAARARPSATVATPLDWSEVEDRSLRPSSFTIASALERTGDPWKDLRRHGRSLSRARRRLDTLVDEG